MKIKQKIKPFTTRQYMIVALFITLSCLFGMFPSQNASAKDLSQSECYSKFQAHKSSKTFTDSNCGKWCNVAYNGSVPLISCEKANEDDTPTNPDADPGQQMGATGNNSCGGIATSILSCGGSKDADKVENTGIWRILLVVLNIMTGLVGLAAVGGIVYASILYTTAQNNSGQVTKAKETIFNVVLGLVLFALMYSFLQFIIPGGIFT